MVLALVMRAWVRPVVASEASSENWVVRFWSWTEIEGWAPPVPIAEEIAPGSVRVMVVSS
jgi:hypothetical protein